MASITNIGATTKPAQQAQMVDTKLEVVVLPVSDVDRAKSFYLKLGWRLDADFADDQGWRVVQLTPPGSACSVFVGKGITAAAPGSVHGVLFVVDDVQAARAAFSAAGVEVSPVFHFAGGLHVDGTKGRVAGPDPEGRSYSSWVSFSDPDGNSFLVQEIKTRLPGRGVSSFDTRNLAELLKEAETDHGTHGAALPKHHWSDWYAAYLVARQRGAAREQAAENASRAIAP